MNSSVPRMSVAMVYGPSHDIVVGPAPELVDMEGRPPAFVSMEFKKYIDLKQTNPVGAPPFLDQLRLHTV